MAGSADTSLLQPFPFSIVHAYSHYHCTSNWISSQAKPLSLSHSSSTPQQHRVQYCYSDFPRSIKLQARHEKIHIRPNSIPQPFILQQQQQQQHSTSPTNRTFFTERHTTTPHTRSHSTPATVPSPVPDGRSSISERAFVRPIHQTAGRPFLPPCRTYGSPWESSA